jgi:hypothetical protein
MEGAIPRGGCRQRAKRASREPPSSALAAWLVQTWAWGALSPQQVQQIAALASEDVRRAKEGGPDFEYADLQTLGGLGSHGLYPNNMNAELMRKVPKPDLPAPYVSSMPLRAPGGFKMWEQTFLWPHELFASLYTNYREHWSTAVCAGASTLQQFWAATRGSPQLDGHPLLAREGFERKCIPIALHGDGVPVAGVGKTWSQSLEIMSWSSLLGRGNTLETQFYVWSVFKDIINKEDGEGDTFTKFWQKLTWSLTWLWRGQWPTEDEEGRAIENARAGTPLAGGYFAVLWAVKCDLDWVAERLQIGNYRALAAGPCALCPCDSGGTPWSDYRRTAVWISRVYSRATWAAAMPNHIPLLDLPGASCLLYNTDLMHAKHLGTDAYFNGSVLWLLAYEILPNSPAANLEDVMRLVHEWYKANPNTRTTFGRITPSMVVNQEAPFRIRARGIIDTPYAC